MGTSKALYQAPTGGAYHDDPSSSYTDPASMASAVLLSDVEANFPDEELPPYQDTPNPLAASVIQIVPGSISSSTSALPAEPLNTIPPSVPFSHLDASQSTHTNFPLYSSDATTLSQMINEQARYPPVYHVTLHGTHTETRRSGHDKQKNKDRVEDFLININITSLLGPLGSGTLQCLPDHTRGYRGGIIPRLKPIVHDEWVEAGEGALEGWSKRFVADKASIKTFRFKRKIVNHDIAKLTRLLRSAIMETNYRGHLSIDFPIQHEEILIYSPGRINTWRSTTWIRWLFYLTFLWIFSWPFLWLITARYEVVEATYAYADRPPGGEDVEQERRFRVASEVDWFQRWKDTVKRSARGRVVCKEWAMDEGYRREMERVERENRVRGDAPVQSTGSAFADGAIGILGQGVRLASQYSDRMGWGGDT